MSINEFPPEPIQALTPMLVTSLRERTQVVLSHLIRTNSISTYFNESEILVDFRDAMKLNHDCDAAFQTFHENIPLSVYDHYSPFISRFFEKPCKMSSIKNLMSSGLPELIAESSGTYSGTTKHFPKYRHPEHMSMSTSQVMEASSPARKDGGKNCVIYSLGSRQVVECVNDDGDIELKMVVCPPSTAAIRMFHHLHVDKDPLYQESKHPDQSSPMGVSFIFDYKSFLFVHALFALYEPKVELINTMFSTTFRDFCRLIDEQWDALVECIDTGSIPELVGVGHLRDKLLKFLHPSPARAAELREIDRDVESPGWFTTIWPSLRVIVAISTGPFQTVVPEIRHYIGPAVELRTLGINCSEAFFAVAYDHRDANLYKVVGSDDIIEFLPIDAPEDAKYVTQSWKVEAGGKYEVILTTRDGLWRYRLGDVIEVVGFDPRDGQPVIHYLERRRAYIRLAGEIVTGQELLDAVHSTSDSFGVVSEFCVSPDYRESIPRYCFFVELHGELGTSPASVSQELHAYIQQHNERYLREAQAGRVTPPTVRVLRRGTFGEYRNWKAHAAGTVSAQVKVPLVVWDEETQNWLAAQVVQEF